MAKVINSLEEMKNEILKEVDGQENFRAVSTALNIMLSDDVVDGVNKAQNCYDHLVELGEQKLADKYIKPLI